MRFDANRALDYARRISFPRKVGTEGESAAAAAITDWFTGMGYEVERQPFRFSYALERLIKLEIFLGQALILAGLAVRWRFPELEIVLAGLVLLLLAFAPFSQRAIINGSLADRGSGPGSWRSRAAELLGSHHEAANIIASRTPHRQEGLRPHLVLMAHYDSKSQTIPLPARMFFFVMLVVGAAGYSLFVFSSQVIPAAREVSLLAAVLALLSGIPLLLLGTGNKSPGSLDNAAGVGLLVHLAEVLASREDVRSGLKVTFVATGAEEYALMGARAFLQSRSSAFADERRMAGVYLLNFDGTGGEGKLNISGRRQRVKPGGPDLGPLLQSCCEELAIPFTRINPPALMMDHMPFAEENLDAVSLSSIGRSALFVHTRKDRVENLSIQAVDQAGQAAICTINHLVEAAQGFSVPAKTAENRRKQPANRI